MAKNKNGRKKLRGKSELPAEVQAYRGPIIAKNAMVAEDLHTEILTYTEFISSGAGGSLSFTYSDNISTLIDSSNFTALYSEFRVLGFRLEFDPNNRYSKTTTICRPIITVVDKASGTAPTSYSTAMAYTSAKKHTLEDPFSREVRMSGSEEAQFLGITSTATTMFIKGYADGLSVSTEYGMITLYFRVQFRGRK